MTAAGDRCDVPGCRREPGITCATPDGGSFHLCSEHWSQHCVESEALVERGAWVNGKLNSRTERRAAAAAAKREAATP